MRKRSQNFHYYGVVKVMREQPSTTYPAAGALRFTNVCFSLTSIVGCLGYVTTAPQSEAPPVQLRNAKSIRSRCSLPHSVFAPLEILTSTIGFGLHLIGEEAPDIWFRIQSQHSYPQRVGSRVSARVLRRPPKHDNRTHQVLNSFT